MSLSLTAGREEVIRRLKDDSDLSSEIKKWFELAGGRQERLEPTPAICPYAAIYAGAYGLERPANAMHKFTYDLRIDFGAHRNLATAEALVLPLIQQVRQWQKDHLGLASDGLANIQIRSGQLSAMPSKEGKNIIWVASTVVRLTWNLI